MFKKLNIKVLVIILVILAAIYAISEFTGNKERSFSRILVAVDTASVSEIHIQIQSDNADIKLVRNALADWSVEANGNRYGADYGVVKSILSQFQEMKPERIAATSKEYWGDFDITDSLAIRVTLSSGKKNVADIYFGKFSYTQPPQGQMQMQQQGKMTTFVRSAKDDRVYAVEGFLRMNYQKDVNSYRNKNLVSVNRDDIARLSFNYPDYSFNVEKVDDRWMINGQPADSLKTLRYLSRIQRLTSVNFVSQDTPKTSDEVYKITVEGNNFSPVELRAISTPDTTISYIIISSANPEGQFDGTKSQLFKLTFVDETEFLPDQPE